MRQVNRYTGRQVKRVVHLGDSFLLWLFTCFRVYLFTCLLIYVSTTPLTTPSQFRPLLHAQSDGFHLSNDDPPLAGISRQAKKPADHRR